MRIGALMIWLTLALRALASVGDQLPEFKECTRRCEDIQCYDGQWQGGYLRLLLWNCAQNCDYVCQRVVTADRVDKGKSVEQFHGKWPFIRIGGIQEPFSVLFSVLNMLPHLKGFQMLSKSGYDDLPMFPYYAVFALIGVNAWIWSSVFHTRDFLVTERLDYFSAILTILYGLFLVVVRSFRLDLKRNATIRVGVIALFVSAYVMHVSYLSFITFSYSYNMAAGVVVGLAQNLMWALFAFRRYKQTGEAWTLAPFYIVLGIMMGMSFELFDFAPFGYLVDAHSLWHAATIIPTYSWYSWMKKDLHSLRVSKSRD